MKQLLAFAVLLVCTGPAFSQQGKIKLMCPLNEAIVVPPPKDVIHYDPADLCIVLQSIPDTVVKAVGTGTVTNIEYTEESKNGVVLFVKSDGREYYFWYTGLKKLLVRRNEAVKAGQPLGYIDAGGKIELLMYEFETPVDPVKYLDCGGILKQ
jgi:multidrug efflux pump subunit AcrA (membrane-fusion protein)